MQSMRSQFTQVASFSTFVRWDTWKLWLARLFAYSVPVGEPTHYIWGKVYALGGTLLP